MALASGVVSVCQDPSASNSCYLAAEPPSARRRAPGVPLVCFAFSLPPSAFTPQVNRATAQTAQEAALEEGLAPLLGWIKRLVDGVIQTRMGHVDLEFAWSNSRPTDPKDQATILGAYV